MIGDRHRAAFNADLLKLIRKHDPTAKFSESWGVTVVTSELVEPHHSLILEPAFSVLAK